MALNVHGLFCADVLLRNYIHSLLVFDTFLLRRTRLYENNSQLSYAA